MRRRRRANRWRRRLIGISSANWHTFDMSTVAEIKEAISHLPADEQREIAAWTQEVCAKERRFTDDGFDIEDLRAKIAEARQGEYRSVNPDEEIRRIVASLDK